MIKIITIYELATGKITKNVMCDSTEIINQFDFETEGYIEGESNDITQYVFEETITDKPTSPCTIDKYVISPDGVDSATISNIPNPSEVSITIVSADGAEFVNNFTVTDGSLVFNSLVVGEYSVKIRTLNYLDYVVLITVES